MPLTRTTPERLNLPAEIMPSVVLTPYKHGMKPLEMQILCRLVASVRPRRAFEIGTYWAISTANIVRNGAPGIEVWTLDNKNRFLDRPPDFPPIPEDGVHYLKANSLSVALPPGLYRSMDLVLVDANHRRMHVASDTRLALDLIAPGGMIVWHDVMEPPEPYPSGGRALEVFEYLSTAFPETVSWITGTSLGVWWAPVE